MSQNKKGLTYKVMVSYCVRDFEKDGVTPIERMVKDAEIEVVRLQRLNLVHSQLALKSMERLEDDPIKVLERAQEFAASCVFDDKVRDELTKDPLACMALYFDPKVQEDFEDFFGNWDFLKKQYSTQSSSEQK